MSKNKNSDQDKYKWIDSAYKEAKKNNGLKRLVFNYE